MALQIRTVVPPGVGGASWAAEVGRMMEDTAQQLLNGVPLHRYEAMQGRYQALRELISWAEDRSAAIAKGEIDDDV